MKNPPALYAVMRPTTLRRALGLCATLSTVAHLPTAEAQTVAPTTRAFVQGDLDGDGFSDLVVPGDQEVLVYFGGRGGVSERPVSMRHPFVFGGQQTRFADAIEDLDGDGVDDAPRELVHPPDGGERAHRRRAGNLRRARWSQTPVKQASARRLRCVDAWRHTPPTTTERAPPRAPHEPCSSSSRWRSRRPARARRRDASTPRTSPTSPRGARPAPTRCPGAARRAHPRDTIGSARAIIAVAPAIALW